MRAPFEIVDERAAALEEIAKLRLEHALLEQKVAHFSLLMELKREMADFERQLREKAYNPDQPRVPAGNPDGGQWTSEGDGSDLGAGTQYAKNTNQATDAQLDDANKLPAEKVGNIIYNETRSLSSLPGSDIDEARADIAHTIRNGEDWGNSYGISRPITASDEINGSIPQAEMQTYSDSQTATTNADASIKQGIDPTRGAIYFYMAGDNQSVKYGKLTLSTGPFHNSFPNKAVPYKEVYINFSK